MEKKLFSRSPNLDLSFKKLDGRVEFVPIVAGEILWGY